MYYISIYLSIYLNKNHLYIHTEKVININIIINSHAEDMASNRV